MVMPTPKPDQADQASVDSVRPDTPEVDATGANHDSPPVIEPVVEPELGVAEVAASAQQSAAPERVSALAVVSVVSALLGFLGITSLLGLALGIVALKQMSTTPGLTGRHLAILGVCVSMFWLVLWLALGSALWVGLTLVNALINALF